jgi:hypothetical protein
LTSLVKKIDQRLAFAGPSPRPAGVYVFFDNSDGMERQLRWMSAREELRRVSLCIGAPPQDYQFSPEAAVTVVIYNPNRRGDQQVKANFALRQGELNEAKADEIVKALSNVLPK